MEKIFNGIRFTKRANPISEKWYDWLCDPIFIPFLENQELAIQLEFDDNELEQFQQEIELTLTNTLQLDQSDRQITQKHLFAYYQDVVHTIGEEDLEDMSPLQTAEGIFRYVRINQLGIGKSSITDNFYANFRGGCGWEPEHGVSISFLMGKQLAMVSGGSHICNSDAFADPQKDRYIYLGSEFKTTLTD